MRYGHHTMEPADAQRAAGSPGVVLKIMPHLDGKPRILELVKFGYADVVVKEAYTGPGALGATPARDGAPGAASGQGDRVGDPYGVRRHPPNCQGAFLQSRLTAANRLR